MGTSDIEGALLARADEILSKVKVFVKDYYKKVGFEIDVEVKDVKEVSFSLKMGVLFSGDDFQHVLSDLFNFISRFEKMDVSLRGEAFIELVLFSESEAVTVRISKKIEYSEGRIVLFPQESISIIPRRDSDKLLGILRTLFLSNR